MVGVSGGGGLGCISIVFLFVRGLIRIRDG